jgi:hypothetical protein
MSAGRQFRVAAADVRDCPLLEAATKQRSEGRDWEHYPVCDSDL